MGLLISEVWTFWTFSALGGTGGPSGLAKSDCLGSSDEEGVTGGSVVQGKWVGGRAGVDGLAHSPWVGGEVCEGGGSDLQGNFVGGRAGEGGLVHSLWVSGVICGGEGEVMGRGNLAPSQWSRQMSGSTRSSTPWTGSTPPSSGSSGRLFSPFLLVLRFNLNFFAGVMHSMSVLVCEASPLEATPPPRWGWW